jgi:hypothetical protein
MTSSLKTLLEFARKWAKHDRDCAIRRGKDCTCGFFEELNRVEALVAKEIEAAAKSSGPVQYCVRG